MKHQIEPLLAHKIELIFLAIGVIGSFIALTFLIYHLDNILKLA